MTPPDYSDLCKRLRGSADFLDKAGFTGFPLIAKDCRDAATEIIGLNKSAGHELNKQLRAENAALRSDNDQLREQVEAFRREQIARSKIDPVTRLHNLCDHLAEQRRDSPFTAESLELADASYKVLCAEMATLREQVAEQKAAAFYWQETAKHRGQSLNKAEAHNAALRQLVADCRYKPWNDALFARVDAAMLAGKEGK